MNIKGAIFDLDGTLLDSMFIWDTIGEEYLIARGITPEAGLSKKFKNMTLYEAAEYYKRQYGLRDSIGEIAGGVNGMIFHLYAGVVKAKDGVLELLERFQKAGVKMCIATASDRYVAKAALLRNDMLRYFEEVFTCNELSCGKDSPLIFYKALERLGTDIAETVVFEDALHAVLTAKSAGFTVAAVYDPSSEADRRAIKEIADFYITSFLNWEGTL